MGRACRSSSSCSTDTRRPSPASTNRFRRSGDYVATLIANEDRLDVVILATLTGGRARLSRRLQRRRDLSNQVRPLSESKRLADRNGSLSIRAQTQGRLRLAGAKQGPTALRAGDYANVLQDIRRCRRSSGRLAAGFLRRLPVPRRATNEIRALERLAEAATWKRREDGLQARAMVPDSTCTRSRVAVPCPEQRHRSSASPVARSSASNNPEATIVALNSAWSDISVTLHSIPPATRFVCELRLELADERDAGFDDYCFAVKDRAFV